MRTPASICVPGPQEPACWLKSSQLAISPAAHCLHSFACFVAILVVDSSQSVVEVFCSFCHNIL
jgi:hypothetical protein